jgi:RNA polymerase sigma factor (sigma-70 family)
VRRLEIAIVNAREHSRRLPLIQSREMSEDWQQDAALLDAWRAGDDRAGEQLFDRHADGVARFFENKVRQGAEDLTQATFLRMIEGRERVRDGVAFRAFVIAIARNVLREHLRELGRGRQVDPEVDCMAELAPGPSTLIGAREEHRLLLEGLRRMPIESQILLELFYWEKLSTQEIGVVLDMSASTIRTRLSRAREVLAEKMAQLADSPEVLASTLQGLDTWAAELQGQLRSDRS